MSNRKRLNISVDPNTFIQLQKLAEKYSFNSSCELLVSLAHILIDRLEKAEQRRYDISEDDSKYIDSMFDDLTNYERLPDENVPVGHNNKSIDKIN